MHASARRWIIAAVLVISAAVVGAALQTPVQTAVPSPAPEFMPDTIFKGSALTGWQPLGDAT